MIGLLILMAIALALLIALLTGMLAWEMRHPPRHTAAYALARGLATDPGDLDLKYESWTLDRPGGEQLPVWDIQSPKSKVQSPNSLIAVFIHGWGHSRIDALARIRPFDQLCDRIIMYDLRGHGEASGTTRLGDHEEEDLLALLDRLGAGPFILVGHSMGAVIALRAAMKRTRQRSAVSDQPAKDQIAGIVAYGPYCEFHRSLIGRLRVAGFPSRPITDLALLVHRLWGIRPANIAPIQLQSLGVPMLVIHGEQDLVAPIEHSRRIARAAAGCTLIEIVGAVHVDAHCLDANRHDQAVMAFISQIASPAAVRV
jgi:pimeloyl-ACP methyl ester carboxylesterase